MVGFPMHRPWRSALRRRPPHGAGDCHTLRRHRRGLRNIAKWYFGINDEKPADTKGHYEFPYGDFENVHRCGVLTAESRAGQYKHFDIENAARA
jgi:hypothetical protein